jgi:hypothetical protein
MKQHAQFSNLLLRMISQVFHEGRVLRNCHDHVQSPPHSAYPCPHMLRRKKGGKVSWEATSFQECFVTTEGGSGRNSEFACIFGWKEAFKGWSKLALAGFQIRLAGKIEEQSEQARDQNRANSKIPDVPKFVVMKVALLSTGVLALVALPCDSGRADLPT